MSNPTPIEAYKEAAETTVALFKEQVLGRLDGHGFEQTTHDLTAAAQALVVAELEWAFESPASEVAARIAKYQGGTK